MAKRNSVTDRMDFKDFSFKDGFSFHFGARRNLSDRCFIKICGNEEPTLREKLGFFGGTFFAARKAKGKTSSKILRVLTFLAITIQYDRLNKPEGRIISFTRKYFHNKMVKMYGDNYKEQLINIWYQDKNHPIHEIVKGL